MVDSWTFHCALGKAERGFFAVHSKLQQRRGWLCSIVFHLGNQEIKLVLDPPLALWSKGGTMDYKIQPRCKWAQHSLISAGDASTYTGSKLNVLGAQFTVSTSQAAGRPLQLVTLSGMPSACHLYCLFHWGPGVSWQVLNRGRTCSHSWGIQHLATLAWT